MSTLPPEPQVTEQARLIVVAIVYLTLLAWLVIGVVCVRAWLDYTPPPETACIAGPRQECAVRTVNGDATLFYVQWDKSVHLASATPERTAP